MGRMPPARKQEKFKMEFKVESQQKDLGKSRGEFQIAK
jgi:hypothetical protein